MPTASISIAGRDARRIWLAAQRLDELAPFGLGPAAVPAAVEYLGYVQIDTIHVIERCHHHILYTRIPDYRCEYLHQAQSQHKSVFEYWTHALSYLATPDMRYYVRDMRRNWKRRSVWFGAVGDSDLRKVLARLRNHGALTIRDIDDDVLVEKDHAWASRKPSKRALQLAFYKGLVTISHRAGMLKTYELMGRHFGWDKLPPAASQSETLDYLLERALRTQGVISVESACYLNAPLKASMRRLIDRQVRSRQLLPVAIDGAGKWQHWTRPATLERQRTERTERAHILSPFDPLIRHRERLKLLFGYEHRFEAYVPKDKRVFGYFACPVLVGDEIVAALDLKTDRERRRLLVQKWSWVGQGRARAHKAAIEGALERFERFQLERMPTGGLKPPAHEAIV